MNQILEACKRYGNPFNFQYHHGLTVRIGIDSVTTGEFAHFEFRQGGQVVLNLSLNYTELVPVRRPDNLITDLHECLKIRQTKSREVLGWLCWPKAESKLVESSKEVKEKEGKPLKATLVDHCQVCGCGFSPGQTAFYVPLDNNITCLNCATGSSGYFQQRVVSVV